MKTGQSGAGRSIDRPGESRRGNSIHTQDFDRLTSVAVAQDPRQVRSDQLRERVVERGRLFLCSNAGRLAPIWVDVGGCRGLTLHGQHASFLDRAPDLEVLDLHRIDGHRVVYVALGRREMALDVLVRARDVGSPQFVFAFIDPRLADLKGDQAFERLRPVPRP